MVINYDKHKAKLIIVDGAFFQPRLEATLTNKQLEMAWSIAQYDVQSAYRYCVHISARNQMKCSICGGKLIKRGGFESNERLFAIAQEET